MSLTFGVILIMTFWSLSSHDLEHPHYTTFLFHLCQNYAVFSLKQSNLVGKSFYWANVLINLKVLVLGSRCYLKGPSARHLDD